MLRPYGVGDCLHQDFRDAEVIEDEGNGSEAQR